MEEAFEQVALCMFDYVTELEAVEIDESLSQSMQVNGLLDLFLIFFIRS
jgi:SHS2 domain-containing protein